MAFRFVPPQPIPYQVNTLISGRIDDALAALDAVTQGQGNREAHIHRVRRRCKQSRALARLMRPSLGKAFRPFNESVRDAARLLSAARDEHVLATTLADLDDIEPFDLTLPDGSAPKTTEASSPSLQHPADPASEAAALLRHAQSLLQQWELPDGFEPIALGLERTYRLGQEWLGTARSTPDADAMHEWRKHAKDLWYQLRLIEPFAPRALQPMRRHAGTLGEDLGDHNDLSVLLDRLEALRQYHSPANTDRPQAEHIDTATIDSGGIDTATIDHAILRATTEQQRLRRRTLRSGADLFAEPVEVFVARLWAYWDTLMAWGPE